MIGATALILGVYARVAAVVLALFVTLSRSCLYGSGLSKVLMTHEFMVRNLSSATSQ